MADWYIRTSSAGTAAGTSWTNAWSIANYNSNQASVAAGDTVWMAGGTYTTGFSFSKSGTAGNPITIKRVLSTDAVPVAASGWSSAFDSLVLITPSGNIPFLWAGSGGDYITIDGRSAYGIEAGYDNTADAFLGAVSFNSSASVNDVTLQYCDLHGPGGATDFNYQGDNAPINIRSGVTVTNLTLSHCAIHGGPNLFYNIADGVSNMTVEYCDIYDNRSSNQDIHANIFYNVSAAHDFHINNNLIHNWQVEGFVLWADASDAAWYFVGNTFYDQSTGNATCFWPGSNTNNQNQGPMYLYNNTFYSVIITSGQSRSWDFKTGSISKNNIFWDSAFASNSDFSAGTEDYNFSDGSTGGAHSISSGSNPFVSGSDFHIIGTIGATYPRDKGVDLGSSYDTDMDGVTRGGDGTWDIGAYEFDAGGGGEPGAGGHGRGHKRGILRRM